MEYHISSLPEITRAHLAAERIPTSAVLVPAKPPIHHPISERGMAMLARLSGNAKNRANARIFIVTEAADFARRSHLNKTAAVIAFCALYNNRKLIVPDWVTSAVNVVTDRSLYRWTKAVQEQGAARLGGNYGNRRGTSKVDTQPELRDLVIAMLVEHPHARPGHILDAARARLPQADLPSDRSLERWTAAWKRDNQQVFAAVTNPDGYKNKHMMAMGSRSEGVDALNQLWEFDSTPADVMLADGRHSIIGVIDVFSRRAKLLVARTSRAAGVTSLARRALLDWGVPEVAKTDNGADYVGHHVSRVFGLLGVEHRCTVTVIT